MQVILVISTDRLAEAPSWKYLGFQEGLVPDIALEWVIVSNMEKE